MPRRDTVLKVIGYGCMLAGIAVMLLGAWAMADASAARAPGQAIEAAKAGG